MTAVALIFRFYTGVLVTLSGTVGLTRGGSHGAGCEGGTVQESGTSVHPTSHVTSRVGGGGRVGVDEASLSRRPDIHNRVTSTRSLLRVRDTGSVT